MTAVLEDTGLDWVTFSDEEPERGCERQVTPCPNVAVYKVRWGPDDVVEGFEDECRNTSLMCLTCFEQYTSLGGLVACGRCLRETGKHFFKRIMHSEFLR